MAAAFSSATVGWALRLRSAAISSTYTATARANSRRALVACLRASASGASHTTATSRPTSTSDSHRGME